MISKDGEVEKLRISTGLSDGKFVEVVEGLNELDEVIIRKKQGTKSKDSDSGFRFKFK